MGGQLHVRSKGGLVAPIAFVMRFEARGHSVNVRGLNHLVAQELGQAISLGPDVEPELEMLRVDAADTQGGEVTFRANRECQVEVCQIGISRMRVRWD